MREHIESNEFAYYAYICCNDNADPSLLTRDFEVTQKSNFQSLPEWERPEIYIAWNLVTVNDIDSFNAGFQRAIELAKEREKYTGKMIAETSEVNQ